MRTLIAIAILLVGNLLTAQVTPRQDTLVRDTTLVPMIALQEVTVSENKSAARAKRLAYLTRKVIKVYPYSKLAAERLVVLNERLEAFDSKYEKKKYIRLVQNYMEDEFEAELKKMSRTDGRILMKLIHRQTGQTTYDLIKAYRSGWNAFWYNTTAGMFDLSLKTEYHPESEEEDFMIESILQKYFRYGILKPQKPAFEINYEDLAKKWTASN